MMLESEFLLRCYSDPNMQIFWSITAIGSLFVIILLVTRG
jgi:hypothetical protein